MGYFSNVADGLLHGMGTDLFAKSANLISGIAPLFAAGFGVYVLLVMISYYNRGLDENIMDFSKRMIGWLVIIACAFNAGTYNKLANLMYGMPEAISGMFGTGEYSTDALDASFNKILKLTTETTAYADSLPVTEFSNTLGLYGLCGVIILLAGVFFTAILSFYLVAKLSLAMVILIGPVFIGTMLFPATRQWGMNWIGQVLNYVVTIVFYVILGSLQHDFFNSHIEVLIVSKADSLIVLLPLACMFITSTMVFLVVAWNVSSIASALTGGASMGGITRTMTSIGNYIKMPSLKFGGGGSGSGGSIKRN
ncbi:type IV secretion system protein [Neisseria sp. Ec49-e6-T10]|uniref:type IV secretion system protein n=1 Tax=Neisseria sp. Ec49-e6-T10 TaxID=3140744 RepID=UPI003EB98D30